jgi:glucose/sorbosone dehydrogenase
MRRPLLGVCLLVALLAFPAGADAALHKVFYAGGFATPVQATSAPGMRGLYVVEQAGRIIRYRNGQRSVFLDIRDNVLFSGEQGLLSLVFNPGYQTNRSFFVYYINNDGDSVVVRYRANATLTRAVESTRRRLAKFDQPAGQTNHKGGTLLFNPVGGGLYLSLGDGGGSCDPDERAQNIQSPLGKILRLTWSGRQVIALGLRNPYRVSFDSQTGSLWIGDVGQSSREELDFLPRDDVPTPAENFEWDVKEGDLTGTCENTGYGPGARIDPVLDYPRSFGGTVIGGYAYRGTDLAGEQGHYFFGDFLSGVIATIDGPNDSTPTTLPFSVSNITSFGEGPGGELFIVSIGGTIYRIAD